VTVRALAWSAVFLLGCGGMSAPGTPGGHAGGGASGGASGGHPGGGAGGPAGGGGGQPADGPAVQTQAVYMTFYGWPDNSPPGGAIAYPKSGGSPTVHDAAGGTGTYDDPITVATDQAEFPVGTRLFAPVLDKYLIMEDDCAECDTDWSSSHKWHIDVWMNSNGTDDSNAVLDCENQWTQSTTTVEVNPPPGRPATAPPLFDTTTNACRTSP
jgi:3D (Asp-Asp-Asp) domain-containing protein